MTSDETTILTALQANGVGSLSGTVISEFAIDGSTRVRTIELLGGTFRAEKVIGGQTVRSGNGATAPLAVTALLGSLNG